MTGLLRDLLLWRHADAGESLDDPAADFERQLSARGVRQARRTARWLRRARLPGVGLVSSPAPRARQTAQAFGVPRIEPRLAPGLTLPEPQELIDLSFAPCVILVGHQPALGLLAGRLLLPGLAPDEPVSIRKGAVWHFVARRDGWRLVSVFTPRR